MNITSIRSVVLYNDSEAQPPGKTKTIRPKVFLREILIFELRENWDVDNSGISFNALALQWKFQNEMDKSWV